MNMLELKIPPPIVALLVGVAMWFVARLGLSIDLPLTWRIAVFAAIALAGGVSAISGDREFKRARTTINPLRPQNTTALVTSGIYRHTRNPMYVGLTLVLLGWAAFLAAALPLAGPVAFVLYISRFQIAPEERVLLGKFGAEYQEYMSRVRRWV